VSTLAKIGFCELALGAVLGWGVVARLERPQLLTRIGIVAPRRVLQAHLDYIMMGIILIATGLALGHLTTWIAVPLVFGTWMNPTLFLLEAWGDAVEDNALFRAVGALSLTATSASLVAVAVVAVGR
jgi:amino acid permease